MPFHHTWRGVIANTSGSSEAKPKAPHQALRLPSSCLEVAILFMFVGVFVMDEKVIVLFVSSHVAFELLANSLWAFNFLLPTSWAKPIHRVNGGRGGLKPIAHFKRWNLRLMSNATKKKPSRWRFTLQQRKRGLIAISKPSRFGSESVSGLSRLFP